MVATPPGDYGEAHALFTAHGGLPGGEKWSCGLRTDSVIPGGTDMQALANYAAECWTVAMGSAFGLAAFNPPTVTMLGVTLRNIDIHGVTTSMFEGLPGANPVGVGTQTAPDQIACVVTLKTTMAGRHGKGRIFFPMLAQNPDVSGNLTVSNQEQVAAAMANLIGNLNGVGLHKPGGEPAGLGFFIAVQSRTSHLPGAVVNQVSVGSVLDTQRRRRKKKIELYSSAAVPVV